MQFICRYQVGKVYMRHHEFFLACSNLISSFSANETDFLVFIMLCMFCTALLCHEFLCVQRTNRLEHISLMQFSNCNMLPDLYTNTYMHACMAYTNMNFHKQDDEDENDEYEAGVHGQIMKKKLAFKYRIKLDRFYVSFLYT